MSLCLILTFFSLGIDGPMSFRGLRPAACSPVGALYFFSFTPISSRTCLSLGDGRSKFREAHISCSPTMIPEVTRTPYAGYSTGKATVPIFDASLPWQVTWAHGIYHGGTPHLPGKDEEGLWHHNHIACFQIIADEMSERKNQFTLMILIFWGGKSDATLVLRDREEHEQTDSGF